MMRAFERRRTIERLEARRNAMVSGIYANSNYDAQKMGQEPPRVAMLWSVEEEFREEIGFVLDGTTRAEQEAKADEKLKSDPFFKSVRKTMGGED